MPKQHGVCPVGETLKMDNICLETAFLTDQELPKDLFIFLMVTARTESTETKGVCEFEIM